MPQLKRARELRRNQTEAEKAAWHLLRDRRLGAKFRRQWRIENWVVDFYCFEHRLAVELDGGVHSQPSQRRRDAAKEDYLRTIGVRLSHQLADSGPLPHALAISFQTVRRAHRKVFLSVTPNAYYKKGRDCSRPYLFIPQ